MEPKKSIFNWQFYFGFVLVVTGGLFLADQILETEIMPFFWPLLVVLLGVTFFFGMFFSGKRRAGLAIPGAIFTTLGILLFIQNTFDIWITWTYAWALLISAAGLGMLIMNIYLKREGLRRAAGLIIGIGLVLFVVFGVLFEVIFNIRGTNMKTGIFLGGGLVLLGLFVIFSRPLFARSRKTTPAEVEEEIPAPGGQVAEAVEAPAVEQVVPVVEEDFEQAEEVEVEAVPEAEGEQDVDVIAEPTEDMKEPETGLPLHRIPEGAEFSGLHFEGFGEVEILQGETCDLDIDADESFLENIHTDVQNGMLTIKFKTEGKDWTNLQWINGQKRVRYTVTLRRLEQIDLAGAGDIWGENLSGDQLNLNHSGAGKLTLSSVDYKELLVSLGGLGEIVLDGEAETQDVDISGAGSYKAEFLKTLEANVALTGAGSAKVWAEAALNATLSGAGSIKYKGDPVVEKNITGLGSIKPLAQD